jgi:hypothetical protein
VEIMSKANRNALFKAVDISGLPVGDFSYETIPPFDGGSVGYVRITHNPTRSQFIIYPDRRSDSFTYQSQVGDDPRVAELSRMNFSQLYKEARRWSADLASWIEWPDLWKSVSASAAIPGELTANSDNTPFAPDEQSAISRQLKIIAESIKQTYELTAEQSAKLDEKFEEAEKASRRMGRKDWGLLFGGAIFSLILADAITPGVAGHILMMIEHGLGHLFGGPAASGILSTSGE